MISFFYFQNHKQGKNETFNTLKNQGYHPEHNFGHGQTYPQLFSSFSLLAPAQVIKLKGIREVWIYFFRLGF